MQYSIWSFLYIFASYLIGSFPSGLAYTTWRYQVDIRTLGSGNTGGTNVGRNFGLKAAIIVTLSDVLKGLLPVLGAKILFPGQEGIIMATALACVIGHAYPIWAQFKGGKMMATSVGVTLAINFFWALGLVMIFALILYCFSRVSLASITSFSLLALYILVTQPSWIYKVGFLIIALFILYRHRSNIHRLINGQEKAIHWGLQNPKKKHAQ